MAEFRLVAIYSVTADSEADAVQRWTALSQNERAATGWLSRVESVDVQPAGASE